MRLCNFIIDFREKERDSYDDSSLFQCEQFLFSRSNPDAVLGMCRNGILGTGKRFGRPTANDVNFVNAAKSLRDETRDKMRGLGLARQRL